MCPAFCFSARLTFSYHWGMIKKDEGASEAIILRRCFALKKKSKLGLVFAIIAAAAALLAAAGAVLLIFEKRKKDEEELERYLDCSIQ